MANRLNQSRKQYNSAYFICTIIVHEPILEQCPSFLTLSPVVTIIYIVTHINVIIIIIVIFYLSTIIITFITLPIKKLETNNWSQFN